MCVYLCMCVVETVPVLVTVAAVVATVIESTRECLRQES